jgi:antitoxin component YwqK of YwqJK toxin-antitoxin module
MVQNNPIANVEVRKVYYKSGALWWETPYKNGQRHGILKGYHESGALMVETPYVDGKEHGIVKWYYPSGALRRESQYENGKMHGLEKDYEEGKSNIVSLALYDKGREVTSVKFSI